MTLERVEAPGSCDVEDSLLTIGELARAGGLPVSALRFYDGAGVLVPVAVDPRTGYRRYGRDQVRTARLIARLRRVGMPLADVRALLAGAEPGPLLDAHLARLEDGLAAARRELSAVRASLTSEVPVLTLTLDAGRLAAALDSVRHAVGTDPGYPALHGVLLDADGDTVHVVGTDRYRLAVATVPVAGVAAGRVFLPVGFVDEVRGVLVGASGEVTVTGTAGTADGPGTAGRAGVGGLVEVTAGGRTVRAGAVADDYPDWRRLEPAPARHRVPLDGPAFRAALAAGPALRKDRNGVAYDAVVLTLGADGELGVGGDGDLLRVGVNRDFLLDALGRHDQLVLELDGPITPLAIRVPGRADWSLLMPVDLTEPAPVG